MPKQEIRAIGVTLTGEAGADDALVAVRVVPAGHDGSRILGRTLQPGEIDPGVPIVLDPDAGEDLHFPPGSISISIQDVDREAKPDALGYAAITNTVWTWLNVPAAPIPPEVYRLLLSAARQLDTAYTLYTETQQLLTGLSGKFWRRREQVFAALGVSELVCIALHRTVRILQQPSLGLQLPASVSKKKKALTDIRDALEHIEQRAAGKVFKKRHPDALSIFDQRDFVTRGVLAPR